MASAGIDGRMSRISDSLRWRLSRGWFGRLVREAVTLHPHVEGPPERLVVGSGVVVNDALLNTASGRIEIGDYSFFGHGVSLLTGTHQITERGIARQRSVPESGRDIVIGKGVWVASQATVLGPCVVGDDAVIAAGSLVTEDVPARAVVGGVPARPLR